MGNQLEKQRLYKHKLQKAVSAFGYFQYKLQLRVSIRIYLMIEIVSKYFFYTLILYNWKNIHTPHLFCFLFFFVLYAVGTV